MKAKLRSLVAQILVITMASALLPTQTRAGMINTEQAVSADRERILVLLDHPDLVARLEAYGVTSSDAKARIAALSDAEVARLATDIDTAQAGAGGGGGVIAVAFVLMMTIAIVVLLPFVIVGTLVLKAVQSDSKPTQASPSQPHQR